MSEVNIGTTPNDTRTVQPSASPTDHNVRRDHPWVQVHPGHIPNDNKEILTVPLVLLAFSIIIVSTRIWTRVRMIRFFGMDDWWILGALASNITATTLSVAGTFKGEGSHINDLEDDELTYLLYVEVILQPVTLNFIKLSILSFYLRLPGTNRFHAITQATFVFIAAMMIAFVLTLVLACIPVSKQWDIYETGGKCIDRALFWHVILAFNVATNIWILVMPVRMLLALKVGRKQKTMVLCIFGCGSIATIASILALAELPLAIKDPDKTWGSWRLAVYAAVENNFGIIAASAPALKPLLGKTARKIKSTVESRLSTTLRNSQAGSHASATKKSKSSIAGGGLTNATVASEIGDRAMENGSSKFYISEVVKRVIAPRASIVSGGRSSASRTGNSSFFTAIESRTHRDSAVLDTIGILPSQAAFPRGFNSSRRVTRVFAGDGGGGGGSAEIHHIRDWQLDQNDYCLDPSVEHNLPQRPKRAYNRVSIDSSPGLLPETFANGRRVSQVDSIGSAISPTDVARDRIVEEDEEEGAEEGRLMSHEEWKRAGGYV
ncbi:hypothetical protein H072_4420 [Dactylellina haptotyla CBS 200.50]|uniref:Rhodopsin domain-containing protein n=1 Tax=Dactylellina haptotyla (strain CBS 200.50) TaxID=1284197 RepID=S8C233_DACHA|nr:hypothetical protein H072_4420 [Dactylellina haptotyla CBS 200.50]